MSVTPVHLCLSVRQPWAWLIVNGWKNVENRTWSTNVRGRILIHASKGMTRFEYEFFIETAHNISLTHPFPLGLTVPAFEDLPRGGIVGQARLWNVVTEHDSPWFFGRIGLVLRNAEPLPFVPLNGALGFFSVPAKLIGARP